VPNRSEGDGLTADLTHAQSLSDVDTERVAIPARLPESGATRRTQKKKPGTHNPEYRMPYWGRPFDRNAGRDRPV